MIYYEPILDDNYEMQILTDGMDALYCITTKGYGHTATIFGCLDDVLADLTQGECDRPCWYIEADDIEILDAVCSEHGSYSFGTAFILSADNVPSHYVGQHFIS